MNPTRSQIRLSETEPLSEDDVKQLRYHTTIALQTLWDASEKQRLDDPTAIPSWIRPGRTAVTSANPSASVSASAKQSSVPKKEEDSENHGGDSTYLRTRNGDGHFFDMYGFLIVRDFCTATEVLELKDEMKEIVDKDWHPGNSERSREGTSSRREVDDGDIAAFGTDAASNSNRGDYFLDSATNVSFFAEPQALMTRKTDSATQSRVKTNQNDGGDDNENHDDIDNNSPENDDDNDDEQTTRTMLRPEYQQNKMAALNKAGHAMHSLPGSKFQQYCMSPKVRDLVMSTLGWQDPVVPQSMYIFKQSQIGGTVHSHQDSTFLCTTPRQTCLGVWLALDDATLMNGCLWVRPTSHREPVRRQFCRNPKYFHNNDEIQLSSESTTPPPKLIFKDHRCDDSPHVTWEGGIPDVVKLPVTMDDIVTTFLPVEVNAGDAVVFCGTLDHLSLPNFSSMPRHTFQLHLVEGPRVGVQWSPENWLQYPPGTDFIRLDQSEQTAT